MDAVKVLLAIAVVAAVVLVLWGLINTGIYQGQEYTSIIKGSHNAKQALKVPALLPRSFNEDEGIEFSFSTWILIRDFDFNFGNKRILFKRGECPAVYLDSTSNTILVEVDTFGAKETVSIPNIPASKWVHLAIVINQYSLNVYVNGRLFQYHTLSQLPEQPDLTTETIVADSSGAWDGVISDLRYYNRALDAPDIAKLAKQVPSDDLYRPPAGPQYFDMRWYTGRLSK